MGFRLVPKLVTLKRQKRSPKHLVFSHISLMAIFVEVTTGNEYIIHR